MSRYPGARWRPTARHQPGGSACVAMTRHDGCVDHTYVGSPSSDRAFAGFNTTGNPTPHFMVYRDGTVDQYIDTAFRSSAVLDGNHRLITWETADGYPGLWTNGQAPKDTPAMVEAKARLMVWLHQEHGIPLKRMKNSRPFSKGCGWHRLGIDGNFPQKRGALLGGRVLLGEHWSTSFGKTCPTDVRIRQFVEETIPLAVELATPPPEVTRLKPRRVYHVKHGRPYYLENSFRGALKALATGHLWIDYDIWKTLDGVLIVAHGPRPLANNPTGSFIDAGDHPADPILLSDTYADLTWAQVQRLRSNDGQGYRVRRADDLIPKAQRLGLGVEPEAKTPDITEGDWSALRAACPRPKKLQAKGFPRVLRALAAAHRARLVTFVLIHEPSQQELPSSARAYLDHYRGLPPKWSA